MEGELFPGRKKVVLGGGRGKLSRGSTTAGRKRTKRRKREAKSQKPHLQGGEGAILKRAK